MASNNITFDPDSGVPFGANFSIYTGGDFKQTFNIKNTSNSAFNLTEKQNCSVKIFIKDFREVLNFFYFS